MFINKTWKSPKRALYMLGAGILFQALLITAFAPVPASAYDNQPGQGVVKDTVKGINPSQATQRIEPTPPFTGGREQKAANTVILDENSSAPSIDVLNYAVSVSDRNSNNLILDCTLSKPEDRATIDRLADRIYRENNGGNYDNVTINWRVGTNPEMAAPWARTTMTRSGTPSFDYTR